MTDITDTYANRLADLSAHTEQQIGKAALGTSTALFVLAILAATTQILGIFGLNQWQSWEVAGVAAGLAAPLAITSIFFLLPTQSDERFLASIGVFLSLAGVLMFFLEFPHHWINDTPNHSFKVLSVYFLGMLGLLVAMFFSVMNIPARSPSSVMLERIHETADTIREKTNIDQIKDPEPNPEPEPEPEYPEGGTPTMDGGSGVGFMGEPEDNLDDDEELVQDDAEILGEDNTPEHDDIDKYCGNCEHFSYKHTNGDYQPHCGLHDEDMDNLDACDQWSPQDSDVKY